jgi:hypothetical protein
LVQACLLDVPRQQHLGLLDAISPSDVPEDMMQIIIRIDIVGLRRFDQALAPINEKKRPISVAWPFLVLQVLTKENVSKATPTDKHVALPVNSLVTDEKRKSEIERYGLHLSKVKTEESWISTKALDPLAKMTPRLFV